MTTEPPVLVNLWRFGMWYFDFHTMRCGPEILFKFPTPLSINANSMWIALDQDRVITCCGTGSYKKAYLLHSTGVVKELPDSLAEHFSAGIILWRGAFHVFAGTNTTRCERMSLSLTHWQRIPDLRKTRTGFNPVEWRNEVYLCGGFVVTFIEVWNGLSFRELEIQLPEATSAVTMLRNDMLIIFSVNYIIYISQENCSNYVKKPTRLHYPNTYPVFYQGLYYVLRTGHLFCYDAMKGEVKDVELDKPITMGPGIN